MKKLFATLWFLPVILGIAAIAVSHLIPVSANSPSTRILITPLGSVAPSVFAKPKPPVADVLDDTLPTAAATVDDPFFGELDDELSLDDFSADDALLAETIDPMPPLSVPSPSPLNTFPSVRATGSAPLVIEFPDLFAANKKRATPETDIALALRAATDKSGGFEAVLTNRGRQAAPAVFVEINPAAVLRQSVALPDGCRIDQMLIICQVASLPAGREQVLAFVTPLSKLEPKTPLINAVAYFEGVDPDVENNTAFYPLATELINQVTPTLFEQIKYTSKRFWGIPNAAAADSRSPSAALVAQGFIMPVLAEEEPPAKEILPEIAVDPKVAMPGDSTVFILTVANRSQTQYAKVHATVFFPFDYLDLINASEPYAYAEAEESIDFIKDTLNPGERWLIRINGKVKEAGQVIEGGEPRTIVNSFIIKAEQPHFADQFASTQMLVVKRKETQTALPSPQNSPLATPSPPIRPGPVVTIPSAQPQPAGLPSRFAHSNLPDTGAAHIVAAMLLAFAFSGLVTLVLRRRRRIEA